MNDKRADSLQLTADGNHDNAERGTTNARRQKRPTRPTEHQEDRRRTANGNTTTRNERREGTAHRVRSVGEFLKRLPNRQNGNSPECRTENQDAPVTRDDGTGTSSYGTIEEFVVIRVAADRGPGYGADDIAEWQQVGIYQTSGLCRVEDECGIGRDPPVFAQYFRAGRQPEPPGPEPLQQPTGGAPEEQAGDYDVGVKNQPRQAGKRTAGPATR